MRLRAPMGLLLVCGGLGAVASAEGPALAAGGGAPTKPVPDWVDVAALDASVARDGGTDYGVSELLSDRQIHVGPSRIERYVRRAFRVETTAGVESSSELHISFDPLFGHLAIHHVHIVRGGVVVDALKGGDWQVIQPESDSNRRIYSGEREGLLFLHDVRMGDVVDYAYTIDDKTPVAGGRLAEHLGLAESVPIAHLRRRVIAGEDHHVLFKRHDAPEAVESIVHGERAYLWDLHDVPTPPLEDGTPSFYEPAPWIDVSEFQTWNDVAKAVFPLFDIHDAPSDAVRALVATWKEKGGGEADRALAATTFVQDEVRYLGIEMGPHSHQPFSPNVTLDRRFGDCKDKALLLVTLLRDLGMKADVALVSTDDRRMLDDRLPSPFAFDHAIVRAVVDGALRWIDATDSLARGPLASRATPREERALVVSPDTQTLETIDVTRPKLPTYEVDETFAITSTPDAKVGLDVVSTYRGDEANEMRSDLASTPIGELARQYLNYYAVKFPKIAKTADPSVSDDPAANVVVVREGYTIADFFADGDRDLWPEAIEKHLHRPHIVRRATPLGVEHPCLVAQHTHLKLTTAQSFHPSDTDITDDALRFHASQRIEGNTVTLDYRYESLADVVPAAKVADHLATLDKIHDASDFHLDPAVARATAPLVRSDAWAWYLSFGLIGFTVGAFGVARVFSGRAQRRRRAAFKARNAVESGEAPSNPIAVKDEGEIASHFVDARCWCGVPIGPVDGPLAAEDVRLGDDIVRVARAVCKKCGSPRRLYFRVGSTQPAN